MAFVRKLFCLHFVLLPVFLLSVSVPMASASAPNPAAAKAKVRTPPDKIVFTNGDQITGKFEREVAGTVFFKSDMLGEVSVPWSKIKELQANTPMAVLDKNVTPRRGRVPQHLPEGTITVAGDMITVHPASHAMIAPIPVKNAQYILDQTTLDKQLYGRPGFFAGWNGSATVGATVVKATQDQRTFNGAVALVRQVPTLSWLDTSNRTILGFTGSYGKITQPAYTSEGVFYPSSDSKSAIFHADAERDEYFSPRFYLLAQTSFDHNYSQGLDLQQIYGAGIGDTVVKEPRQMLDIKATMQYENQEFINATDGVNQKLIGSTFAGVYLRKLPHKVIFNQQVAYIPAYNNANAYSATESNTVAIPFYKDLSFSVGTVDSYLNNPAPAIPPTMRNSFQFAFGATYLFKSKY
jgi:Protein of unknown function, DUF481